MDWNVIWTATAKNSLADIKQYLLLRFTQKEFDKLKESINKQIATIQKGNVKHVYFKRTDTHKVVELQHQQVKTDRPAFVSRNLQEYIWNLAIFEKTISIFIHCR